MKKLKNNEAVYFDSEDQAKEILEIIEKNQPDLKWTLGERPTENIPPSYFDYIVNIKGVLYQGMHERTSYKKISYEDFTKANKQQNKMRKLRENEAVKISTEEEERRFLEHLEKNQPNLRWANGDNPTEWLPSILKKPGLPLYIGILEGFLYYTDKYWLDDDTKIISLSEFFSDEIKGKEVLEEGKWKIGEKYEFLDEGEWTTGVLNAVINHDYPYIATVLCFPMGYESIREISELPKAGLLVYKTSNDLIFRTGEGSGYGFLSGEDWCTGQDFSFSISPDLWRKATLQDSKLWEDCCKNHLTEELGLEEGDRFKDPLTGSVHKYSGVSSWVGSLEMLNNQNGGCLMYKGVWAKPVEYDLEEAISVVNDNLDSINMEIDLENNTVKLVSNE